MFTKQQPNLPPNIVSENDSRLPLWVVLVVPFILIIVGTVSSINYLSYRNSQSAIDAVVMQLLEEINTRIETHIDSFLEIPLFINQSNANVIKHDNLDATDIEAMGHYFWEEVQLYETVSSIYFGNPEGGLVVGGREGTDGSLYIITTDNFESGSLNKYATDSFGNLTDLIVQVPQFDSRLRPWYIGAVEGGGTYWTEPYVLSTQQDLAIASSLPVYDDVDNFIGVLSVDIFISQINDFLQEMDIGKTGRTYIVEHSGLLIATSSEMPTVLEGDVGLWERVHASESDDPIVAESTEYIVHQLGNFLNFDEHIYRNIYIDGKEHYLWVSPFHDVEGLDWLIVTVIPKDDFLGTISAHNQITLLLTLVALGIAVVAAIVTAFYISRPITRLSAAATQLAQGDLSQRVPIKGVREFRALGQAFNLMAFQLHELFNKLEDRVQARTVALATSEARYRGIVDDQTELICRFSPDYTLTFVNEAYCQYYDETESDLLGYSFMPKLPEKYQNYLKEQLASLNPTQQTIKVEHKVFASDNQVRWVQWINRAFFDELEQIVEIQAVGRDITEQKQHEEALQKALDRETELNQLKSHFITTVSHEFRTPMTIILNSSEMLEKYADRLTPEKKAVQFKRIQEQIQQMVYLLDEVLTIHEAENKKRELKLQKIDLANLCQNVIGDLKTTAQNITFDFHFKEDCRTAFVDERYVRLIVANLFSNAVKYSPAGGTIEVQLDCDEGVRLSVKDEGIGIPEANQAHIFEPFYRADNIETVSGTGLGLSIVKKCVAHHHGIISFESKMGVGTTFTIQLPNIEPKEINDENDSRN